MICKNCKKEIPDNSLFCEFCGEKVEQSENNNSEKNIKICPNCGNQNDLNSKFCKNCGFELKQNNKKIKNIGCMIFLFIVTIVLAIFIFLPSDFITFEPKAKNCEDSEVMDLVIELFKRNDRYFKDIDPDSISSIYIQYPAVTSYDKEIDKYFCDGHLVMESYEGFRPTEYDYFSNSYYIKTNHPLDTTFTKYTKYVCPVNYSSQISEGTTLVSSSTLSCNFSCEGDCTPLINYEKKKKIEENRKIEEQKRLEEKKQREQSAKVPETPVQRDMKRYVANIERKLKMNWDEPKDIGNNPVELKFKIGKDGSLISYNIYKSSGSTSADKAAVEALKRTAPFTPLPESFTGSSVDVLFTFDLKIFH